MWLPLLQSKTKDMNFRMAVNNMKSILYYNDGSLDSHELDKVTRIVELSAELLDLIDS
jgi:hypothetical protein